MLRHMTAAIDLSGEDWFFDQMTIYAVGDIHGHLEKLEQAHAWIEADRAREGTGDAGVVHVGDLVDRGPDSAGVITYLMNLRDADPRVIILRGNHDQLFVDFLTQDLETCRANGTLRWTESIIGGRETLASYGVENWFKSAAHREGQRRVPIAHIEFMAHLPLTHEAGDCLFVHAGIRPGVALSDQDPEDLIWIRQEFLTSQVDHGPLVVHGHTPTEEVEHHGNRLAIDTGAAFGGPLSAVVIEGRDAYLLTETDRIPIPCS